MRVTPTKSDHSRSAALQWWRQWVIALTALSSVLMLFLVLADASVFPLVLTGAGIVLGLEESISLTLRLRRQKSLE
jgi:hypothetical protein